MNASFASYTLDFIQPGGTSRGVLTEKETFFLMLREGESWGIGECALFRGLSFDDRSGYEARLQWLCDNIGLGLDRLREELKEWPSIVFGLEQAWLSLAGSPSMELFDSEFLRGRPIPINGLIWMGHPETMTRQIEAKIRDGFTCIKMKIGSLDFAKEYAILREVRRDYPADVIELRVDANGAFTPGEALGKLDQLALLDIHSIEQPIRQGQWDAMAQLCRKSPVPIALDEELIGVDSQSKGQILMDEIRPHFLILKPSLLGGFAASQEWIRLAGEFEAGWWVTSALESNIGLNAIAQWTAGLDTELPQGLGTGSLFKNNFSSPLAVTGGKLHYRASQAWDIPLLKTLCI